MARAKTVKLFLMDGTADGRIKCTMDGWIGEAYKIPRSLVSICKDRKQLQWSGVYFLFGQNEKNGNNCVYVGQAGERKNSTGITQRLMEHDRSKESYWNEAVAFTTSNNTFGPTDITYLENYFYNKALRAGRYEMVNAVDPTQGHITEEKEAELLAYADAAETILTVLGYKVLQESQNRAESDATDHTIKVFLNKSYLGAAGIFNPSNNHLTILAGSVVSEKISKKYKESNAMPYRLRIQYERDGIIQYGVFAQDSEQTSPSYAAAIILGRSSDGRLEWKTSDGIRLGDLNTDHQKKS